METIIKCISEFVYIVDGKEFKNKFDAIDYENKVKISKIEHREFDLDEQVGDIPVSDVWYRAKSEEELDILLECWGYNSLCSGGYNFKKFGTPTVGEWLSMKKVEDGWEYMYYFVTMTEYIQMRKDSLRKQFEQIYDIITELGENDNE